MHTPQAHVRSRTGHQPPARHPACTSVCSRSYGKERALAFGAGDPANAVDWVVVMRRFAQDQLLERRLHAGDLSPELLTGLAGAIAQFHATAERCPDIGGSAVIARTISDALGMFHFLGRPFDPGVVTERFAEMASASTLHLLHRRILEQRQQMQAFCSAGSHR